MTVAPLTCGLGWLCVVALETSEVVCAALLRFLSRFLLLRSSFFFVIESFNYSCSGARLLYTPICTLRSRASSSRKRSRVGLGRPLRG